VSDEPNNPIQEPVEPSPEVAENIAPSVAEQAGANEGMAEPIEPAGQKQPEAIESAPELIEASPPAEVPAAEAEAPTPDAVETPAAEAEAPTPDAVETPAAEAEAPTPDAVETPAAEAEAPESATAAQAPAAQAPAEEAEQTAAPPQAEVKPSEPKSDKMDWYILKVQSNREESIREGLLRRVAIAGLDRFFGEVIVPTEKVTEFKGGKKRIIKRKLYPGYLVVQMEINDETWFLVRETPGIGDFTGAAGRPSPMLPHEVQRIVAKAEEKSEKTPKLKIGFSEGERVKIKEGTFENFEGDVESIDQTNGQVTVMINIFGRSTPVTLEYWQIEAL
jgi:transcriptional antiterminator NusG